MKTFLLIFIFVLAVILTFSLMTSEKNVFAFKPYLYKEITFKTNIPYIYPHNSSISKENNEYVVYTRFDNSGGIINKIKHFVKTGQLLPKPSIINRVQVCKNHLQKSIEWKGEKLGVVEMRNHYANYFKGIANFKDIRIKLVTLNKSEDLFLVLDEIINISEFQEN